MHDHNPYCTVRRKEKEIWGQVLTAFHSTHYRARIFPRTFKTMGDISKADVAKGLEQCKGIVNSLLEHEESGT